MTEVSKIHCEGGRWGGLRGRGWHSWPRLANMHTVCIMGSGVHQLRSSLCQDCFFHRTFGSCA